MASPACRGPVRPRVALTAGRSGRGALVALLLALVALVAVAVVVVVVLVVADDDETAEEVFLEPIATARDPFTEPVGTDATLTAAAGASVGASAGRAIASRAGGEPGLYGGTQREGDCDTDQLAAFLAADRAKAEAWAGVVGVPVADVPGSIDRLTPVLLRSDTRVTNHGFADGRATAIQAVLVDDRGRPVTKCYCGNPLSPPEPTASRYRGSRWDGFDEDGLTLVVENVVVVETFVLVDVVTGETFSRPTGSDGDQDGPPPASSTTTTTTTTGPASTSAPATTETPTTEAPTTTEASGPDPLDGTYSLHAEVAEGSNGSCVAYDVTFAVDVEGTGAARTVHVDGGSGNLFEGPLGEDGSFDLSAPLPSGEGTQTLTGRFVAEGGAVTISGTGSVDSGDLLCNLDFTGERTG